MFNRRNIQRKWNIKFEDVNIDILWMSDDSCRFRRGGLLAFLHEWIYMDKHLIRYVKRYHPTFWHQEVEEHAIERLYPKRQQKIRDSLRLPKACGGRT